MKNKVWMLVIFSLLFTSCNNYVKPIEQEKNRGNINIVSNEHIISYTGETRVNGNDISLTFSVQEGYEIVGSSYKDYEIKLEDGKYIVLFHSVKYPEMISLNIDKIIISPIEEAKNVITYNLNDGTGTVFTQECKFGTHKRINTSQGKELSYDGHVLIGWNTKEDMTGDHIGLGSRVTYEEDMKLYAEWKKETTSTVFSGGASSRGYYYLSKYKGPTVLENLVIPQNIEGSDVSVIKNGFAEGLIVENLVIPSPITVIEKNAFKNCTIKNLYITDNTYSFYDESFEGSSIEKLHLNAYLKPSYQKSEIASFADSIDRIILADKKKMIFYGGCSFAYGLNSKTIEEQYPDYTIINCGIIGGTNSGPQMDIITNFVSEGDVFIHAPEEGSPYQLMALTKAESRLFLITEGNYDLLSYVDTSKVEGFYTCLANFIAEKQHNKIETEYSDSSGTVNEYGDVITERPSTGIDESFTEGYTYELSYITNESMDLLKSYYKKIENKGVRLFFTYAPVNKTGLTKEELSQMIWSKFDTAIRSKLKNDIKFISLADTYLYDGRYFYDMDYHLNDEGVALRTKSLLNDMKNNV